MEQGVLREHKKTCFLVSHKSESMSEIKQDEEIKRAPRPNPRKYSNIKMAWEMSHPGKDFDEMVNGYAKQAWAAKNPNADLETFDVDAASDEKLAYRNSDEWKMAEEEFSAADAIWKEGIARFKIEHKEEWAEMVRKRSAALDTDEAGVFQRLCKRIRAFAEDLLEEVFDEIESYVEAD